MVLDRDQHALVIALLNYVHHRANVVAGNNRSSLGDLTAASGEVTAAELSLRIGRVLSGGDYVPLGDVPTSKLRLLATDIEQMGVRAAYRWHGWDGGPV